MKFFEKNTNFLCSIFTSGQCSQNWSFKAGTQYNYEVTTENQLWIDGESARDSERYQLTITVGNECTLEATIGKFKAKNAANSDRKNKILRCI